MPMNILQNTGPRNVKFSHCRTAITQPASRKNRKLKYVKTFFAMISRTDAPGDSTGALPQPPSSRSCAAAALKPGLGVRLQNGDLLPLRPVRLLRFSFQE